MVRELQRGLLCLNVMLEYRDLAFVLIVSAKDIPIGLYQLCQLLLLDWGQMVGNQFAQARGLSDSCLPWRFYYLHIS